jgi:biopolymer transport protein ExbB
MLTTALDRYNTGMGSTEIQEGLEEVAIQEVPRLSERLNYLVLFANIATLLGLLGTITGLQLAFSSLGSVEASKKPPCSPPASRSSWYARRSASWSPFPAWSRIRS